MPVSSRIVPKMGMKKPELGMIQLSLMGWIAVGAAVVIGIMYLRIDYLEMKVELADAFQESVEREGETARKEARRINKENLAKKEKADAELKKLRLANADLNKRLRDSTGRGSMSGNEASTRIPESSCVSGGVVNDAVSRFSERIESISGRTAELIIEGQSALDDLNNAKAWAQER